MAFADLVLGEYLRTLELWKGKGQGFAGHMLTCPGPPSSSAG